MNKLPALFAGPAAPGVAPPDGVIVFWFECPILGRTRQLGVTLVYLDALAGERATVPFGGLVLWAALLSRATCV